MNSDETVGTETLPEDREDRIGWAYKVARRSEEARARFDAWAEEYDRDVHDLLGWVGPEVTLDYVIRHVAKDARILDAGSGTGLMGALLHEQGYHDLVATDISDKMLEVAREKNVYKSDFQADLIQPLPLDNERFDCIVAVGVSGYMIAETIGDFLRALKPGGHIIYTISDAHFDEHGFNDVVNALTRMGSMSVVEKGDEFPALPKSDPDHLARVHVYQKAD